MANKYLDDFKKQYPMYKNMDDTTLAKNIHQTFYKDMNENDYMSKLGLYTPMSEDKQEETISQYKTTTPNDWGDKIGKDINSIKEYFSSSEKSPTEIAAELNSSSEKPKVNINEILQGNNENIDIPDIPTLEEKNSNIIDQVQSSFLQQSRESARAITKNIKQGLSQTSGLSDVANNIDIPERISQSDADKIVGYSQENRNQDNKNMQEIRKNFDDSNYGTAFIKTVEELPSILGDSSGEMFSMLTLPATALAIQTRVSKFEDDYMKNNEGKKPDQAWYDGAVLSQAALLLGERFGLGKLGEIALGKASKKIATPLAIGGAGAYEYAQEGGEYISQEYLTQKEEAKTLLDIATSPDAQFNAFVGLAAGTTLGSIAKTSEALNSNTNLTNEEKANKVTDELNKNINSTTLNPDMVQSVITNSNVRDIGETKNPLDSIVAGFAKLQEEIKVNNEKPIEELLQKDLEVKQDDKIKPLDNNIPTNETTQIDNNPLPVPAVEETTNPDPINANENAVIPAESKENLSPTLVPQLDENNKKQETISPTPIIDTSINENLPIENKVEDISPQIDEIQIKDSSIIKDEISNKIVEIDKLITNENSVIDQAVAYKSKVDTLENAINDYNQLAPEKQNIKDLQEIETIYKYQKDKYDSYMEEFNNNDILKQQYEKALSQETTSPTPTIDTSINENLNSNNESIVTQDNSKEWFKNNPIRKTTNINSLYRNAVNEYNTMLNKEESNQKTNSSYTSKLEKAKNKMDMYYNQLNSNTKSTSNNMYMKNNKTINENIINTLEEDRTVFEERPYTKKEWDKLFPGNKIISPIGEIKLGENQFEKLDPTIADPKNLDRKKQDRRGHLDYIYKTLLDPTYIVKKDNKFIFIKEFIRPNDSTRKYSSIVIEKDGLKINISNYSMQLRQIINEIKKGDNVINTVEVATNQSTNSDTTSTFVADESISKKDNINNSKNDTSFMAKNNTAMPNNPESLTGKESIRLADKMSLRGKKITLPDKFAPMTPAAIRKQVIAIIGNRLYFSKIKQKAEGFYKKKTGETRIKDINNIEVYAHEIAHYLDFYNGNKVFKKAYTNKDFKDEVESFSYTQNDEQKSFEGFAEYVRAYLTQYEFAKSKAPLFTEEFEMILKSTGLGKSIHKLQEDMHKFYYQGDEAIFSALIGDKKSKLDALKETIFNIKHSLANKTLINFFDRTHGFSVAEFTMFNKLQKGEQSPTKLLRLALGGSAATYESVIKYGTPTLTAKGDLAFNGKGLTDIFEPVLKEGSNEFKELMEYFAAVQANEMMNQGKKTPFSKSQIETILKRGDIKPLYKRVFQDYQDFNNRMLDFYVQMDYLTPTDVENFRNKNTVYVPMQRVVESMGQKDGSTSSAFFGRKGSDRNIRDIEKNITEQLFYHIRGAMLSHAKSKLFNQLGQHEDGSLFAVNLAADTKKVKVNIEQQAKHMVDYLYQGGMMVDEFGDIVELDENISLNEVIDNTIDTLITKPYLMNFMSFGHKPKNAGSNIEEVIINGNKKYFEIQTGELGDLLNITLNNLGGIQYGKIVGALYAFKNFKTRAITAMPQFKLPNMVRDTLDAQVFRKTKSIVNPLAGAKSYLTIDDAFKNYMLNGGGYGTLLESTTSAKPDDIFKESTWQKFDRFMSFDEYSNRVSVAENTIEEGGNWFEAAYQGRDLTVDFAMVGANPVLRKFLKLMPFQQAGINGMYKLIREIKDEGHNAATYGKAVLRLSTKGLTYLTPIAMLAFMTGQDDERYKALTSDELARFLWFFYDKNEQPIKIPIPFGLGAIFQKFPEYIMSALFSDGDYVDNRYKDAVMFAVMHQLVPVPNGGIFDPLLQGAINKNFTGSPIVSSQLEKVEPYLQYNSLTPEIYKGLGHATGLSPLKIEHYTKGTLGYIENAITGMSQIALWDKENFGEMPYSSTKDYVHGTFFKQFYKMNDTSRTAWSEEYYKYREKIDTAYYSVQFTNKQIIKDKGDSYEEYLGQKDKVLLSSLKKFTTNLDGITAQLKKAEDSIIFDKKLTAVEKEKKLDDIYKQQNVMFKQVYKEINKVVGEKR